jgi:hypothetical protein
MLFFVQICYPYYCHSHTPGIPIRIYWHGFFLECTETDQKSGFWPIIVIGLKFLLLSNSHFTILFYINQLESCNFPRCLSVASLNKLPIRWFLAKNKWTSGTLCSHKIKRTFYQFWWDTWLVAANTQHLYFWLPPCLFT